MFEHPIDYEQFLQQLNPGSWNIGSTEGIIMMLIAIFMIYAIGTRMLKAVTWCAALMIFIQVLYCLSFTPVNDIIPISSVIQYDVMGSVAQVFAGTFIGDILVHMSAWLNYIMYHAGYYIAEFLRTLSRNFNLMDFFPGA